MNSKKMISYIQKGEETSRNLNYFNKKTLTKEIFETAYQTGNAYEFYHIKNEIEYLHLKNIIFNKNINFIVPDNTILIFFFTIFRNQRFNLF